MVKPRLSLSAKILLLAFLNVVLLGLVFLVFARIQFRLDLSSFVLAPARDRMLSVSRLIALQLPDTQRSAWNQLLAQYSASYSANFYLFDSDSTQLAGQPVVLPHEVMEVVLRDPFGRPSHDHSRPAHPREADGRPPLLLTRTTRPAQYWVGVHIPVWIGGQPEPIHGTLLLRFPSPWTNPFFFDYRPWLAVVLAVVVVSVICWLPLIRGMTHSITQLTRATGRIAEGHFEVELPKNRHDELGRLSDSIDRMTQRLSGFVHGQRRFLSDIAHELCSPIARMQVALGILEQRAQANQVEYVVDVQEEVAHMSGLIDELLAFSKSQISAGANLTRVNVADTVRGVLEREAPDIANIETHIDKDIEAMAQPDYLFRALSNVVRNAIRYAGQAGPILISANRSANQVCISVADNGPGLPESELENVFKPFYRPEFARQRETGGAGLGLAIVKSCIEACGGVVECRNRRPKGLEVEIRLVES